MKRYALSLIAVAISATCSAAVVTGTKTVTGTFNPGGTVTYTIVLSNAGPGAQADNPGNEFVDVLPASVTLVSANSSSGTVVATSGTNTVTWNGALSNGGSVTITITATISAAATNGDAVSNTGVIDYDADDNGTNETQTTTTTGSFTVVALADLSITKTGPATMGRSSNASYTITVSNAGPQSGTAVTVTDVLPPGTTFVSATPSQGSCGGTSTVTCSLGTMANGGSATVALVLVTPVTAGLISNTATVSTTASDSNPGNNSSTANTTVTLGVPTLSLPALGGLALLLMGCGALFIRRLPARP